MATVLYAKLTLRSLCRSWCDYGLHFATLTLLFSLMSLSNLVSAAARLQAGFETAALPLLITLLSLLLLHDCNRFLLARRAREFALYLLLGMERTKLSLLFFLEELLLGLLSLAVSLLIGFLLFSLFSTTFATLVGASRLTSPQLLRAAAETMGFFALIEVFSLLLIHHTFQRMELRDLLETKRGNQPLGTRGALWAACAGVSFLSLLALMAAFVFLPEEKGMPLISIIALPLLLLVFSFYQAFFTLGGRLRARGSSWFYQKDRLYQAGNLFSQSRSEARLNSTLCLCLLLSSMAFLSGGIMLQPEVQILDPFHQRWMGFLQLCICAIFMVIYFAVLSLRQMMDLQRERSGLRLLWHLGKTQAELRGLLAQRLRQKFSLPLLLWGILFAAALPLTGGRVDQLLRAPWLTLQLAAGFLVCFTVLYHFYFSLIYRASAVYLNHILPATGNNSCS